MTECNKCITKNARIAELESFISSCGDCKSADELHDFVVNNLDKIETEETEEKYNEDTD